MSSVTSSPAVMIASTERSIAASTARSASSDQGGRRSRNGSAEADLGAIENSTGELDIFRGRALPVGIPEERRGVIGGDERDAVVAMLDPPKLRDRSVRAQQSLCCERAERDYHFRLEYLELPQEERAAGDDLGRRRVAVPRRTVFE